MTMEEIKVTITDNSTAVKSAMKDAILRALEKCGLLAEGFAKKLCPVDTGNLRNSITHVVDEDESAAIIGTNNEYAAYVELGTGKYAEGGGGRPTGWAYQDAEGNWDYTHGQEPQLYLKLRKEADDKGEVKNPKLLKHHKADVIAILAVVNGVAAEDYRDKLYLCEADMPVCVCSPDTAGLVRAMPAATQPSKSRADRC